MSSLPLTPLVPGSLPVTAASRTLGPVRDVKADFGAKGDGSDDTAAFAAASAYGSGRIVVPPGDYVVSSVAPESNQEWFGIGRPTITHKPGEVNAVFYWPQSPRTLLSNVMFQGLKLVGDLTATVENQRAGIFIVYGDNIRVFDCEIQDFASAGIHLSDVQRYWIEKNKVTGCCHHGVRNSINVKGTTGLSGPTSDLANGYGFIRGNYVKHDAVAGAGIAVTMPEAGCLARSVVSDNIVRGGIGFASIAVEAGVAKDSIVHGNQCYGGLVGISVLPTTVIAGEQVTRNIVTGNIVDSETVAAAKGIIMNGSDGVVANNQVRATSTCIQVNGTVAQNARNVVVAGNTLVQANADTLDANKPMWLVAGNVRGLAITGNTFRLEAGALAKDMINIGPVDRFTITGNLMDTPGRNGINLTSGNACTNGLIADNVIIDANDGSFANGAGILIASATSDRLTIRGNIIRDTRGTPQCAFGIFQQAAATNVFMSDNDISGMLTKNIQVNAGSPVIRTAGGFLALTYGVTVATDATVAEDNKVTVTDGVAFTISSPTNPDPGRTLTYDILNSSGGAMGAITWGGAFKLAGAFTNPASTKRRTISFYYDGTNWVETYRAAADI